MQTLAIAHSKFILSGEHFVVGGTPSLVLPGACFSTQVTLREQPEKEISVQCSFDCEQPEVNQCIPQCEALVRQLLLNAARMLNIQFDNGLHCVVKSTIPPGQGAGSSSALCQAIVEAMIKHFVADDFHPNYLKWFGTSLENTWHGPVSGIDNAAIAYRRILLYQKGSLPEPILPGIPLFFVIATTGPRQGVNPYQAMRWLKDKQPLQCNTYRKVMTQNAKSLAENIKIGNLLGIGDCMNESHALFKAIGIVTEAMDNALEIAKNCGAFGARMTGAGGGGFVIACVPVHCVENLQKAWMNAGLKCIRTLQFGLQNLG